MPHFMGNARLIEHILQFIDGRSPGGDVAMTDFFYRLNVTVDHVIEALLATNRGNAATVAQYVSEHPELAEWYSTTPTLKAP